MQSKDGVVKQAMSLIKNGMTVGLGGGSTVALLAKSIHKSHLEQIRIVTLSEETKSVCTQLGFVVEDFNEVSKIHYAFDGCDRVDRQFQALKTKGGIQTQEKIVAFLAEKYILFADEEKFSDYLTFDLPICCEILPNSLPVVKSALKQANATITIRQQEDNEPYQTVYGNWLIDVKVNQNYSFQEMLYTLEKIPGMVSHSLFNKEVTGIIMKYKEKIAYLERKQQDDQI